MKLHTSDNVIEKSGDLTDEKDFKIALTAKAIEVLSSQIYKDAKLAIVRELATNAADSHIEAGKRDVPFEVTLPNELSPEFVIRDYGTGMSYKKVMTMYRTYFGSDKTNSDEVTGCLGLGSKSPLAYTDQFNVTSWYEGEKSIYTVYKNERGLPAINRIYHGPSDEPTGVEVRLSIKRSEFWEFRQKALQTYVWFAPRPIVAGISEQDWPKESYAMESTDWKLRRDAKKMTVVMGNVAYHVEGCDLEPIIAQLAHNEKILCRCGPVLHVNIGDVEIAASRETLKFDGNKTYPAIEDRLQRMAKEIIAKFQAEIDACKTHWDARVTLKRLRQTPPLGSLIPSSVLWNGIPVETSIQLSDWSGGKLVSDFAGGRMYRYQYNLKSGVKSVRSYTLTKIDADDGVELFVGDSKNVVSRLCHYVRNHPKRDLVQVVLLTPAEGMKSYPDADVYDLDRFAKEFHLSYQRTSSLPDKPKNAASSRSKSFQILKPLHNKVRGRSSDWEQKEIDFDEGGVYVEVKGNHWSAGLQEQRAAKLFEYASMVDMDKLVGVRCHALEEFEEADQWVRLDRYIIDKYKDNVAAKEAAMKMFAHHEVHSRYSDLEHVQSLEALDPKKLDGLIKTLVEKLLELKNANQKGLAQQYQWAMPFLGVHRLDVSSIVGEVERMYKAYQLRYPLLDGVNYWHSHQKSIYHYVGLVEGVRLTGKKKKRKKQVKLELV